MRWRGRRGTIPSPRLATLAVVVIAAWLTTEAAAIGIGDAPGIPADPLGGALPDAGDTAPAEDLPRDVIDAVPDATSPDTIVGSPSDNGAVSDEPAAPAPDDTLHGEDTQTTTTQVEADEPPADAPPRPSAPPAPQTNKAPAAPADASTAPPGHAQPPPSPANLPPAAAETTAVEPRAPRDDEPVASAPKPGLEGQDEQPARAAHRDEKARHEASLAGRTPAENETGPAAAAPEMQEQAPGPAPLALLAALAWVAARARRRARPG